MANIDIVVPCYNYARFLDRCVESVLSQANVNVRVLIIDDASSDETPMVGEGIAARDSRVEYRRHAANKGHIASYNEGLLEWAEAPYSLLLSADDYLAPGALFRATDLLAAHQDVGMTYGMAVAFSDDVELADVPIARPSRTQIVLSEVFLGYCFTHFVNPVPTPTAVVRTAIQHRVGGYDAAFPHTGDMEMWMRFASHGTIGVVADIQAYYRRHSSNMSSKYYLQELGDRRERLKVCERVLDRLGTKFSQYHETWRSELRTAIGMEAFWSASSAFDDGDLTSCLHKSQFALEVYPEIRKSAMWWRFQMKRSMGIRLWNRMQVVLDWVRSRQVDLGVHERRTVGEAIPGIHGWWPESAGD